MRSLILVVAILAIEFASAAQCYPVPGTDGQFATVVCVPTPIAENRNFNFGFNGDFSSRGIYSGGVGDTGSSSNSSPPATTNLPPPASPSPTFLKAPNTNLDLGDMGLSKLPNFESPKQFQWQSPKIAPMSSFGISVSAQDAAAYAGHMVIESTASGVEKAINSYSDALSQVVAAQKIVVEAEAKTGNSISESYEKNKALKSAINGDRVTDRDGLITSKRLRNNSMRSVRDKIRLKSTPSSLEGRVIRKGLNRALLGADAKAPAKQIEALNMSIALSMGADAAAASGETEAAARISSAAAVATDLALGFIPYVGAFNDAYQIILGSITGYDYTGHRMESADYTLRGIAIVLSIIPVRSALRIGRFAYERALLETAEAARKIEISPKLGNLFVRNLPDLAGTFSRAFDGHIFKGTYEPGELLFQSQRTGQTWTGRWFGPIRPIDGQHADELYNIFREWKNNAGQIKAFVVTERVSGYAGKVAGGTGHQFYIPDDIPLDKVLKELKP